MTFRTLTPPKQSNRQVREYVEAVEKGLDSYFVVENGKGWYVRKASTANSKGKFFEDKEAAIEYAMNQAIKKQSEVLVFDNKGSLLSRQ